MNYKKQQQNAINKETTKSVSNNKASYVVSSFIAKIMKPCTGGEFVKECLMVVGTVCLEKIQLFDNISVSASSGTRQIENMSSNVKERLKSGMENFEFFSERS